MRNLFDQYNQPENRLSHALAVCLNEDRALLRKFLTWNCVKAPVPVTRLVIDEQSLPGNPVESAEKQAERKRIAGALSEESRRAEFSADERELGRSKLTPRGECGDAVEREMVP